MKNKIKLTPSMQRMLRDAWLHGDPHFSLRSRAEHGGAVSTMYALVQRGLMSRNGSVTSSGLQWLDRNKQD